MSLAYEIDDDEYPFTAVTFIRSTWPNGQTSTGTGFIVGDNDVLTASHVVYNGARGGDAVRVEVIPSYDPDSTDHRSFYASTWLRYSDYDPDFDGRLISGDFRSQSIAGSEKDVALLTVPGGIGSFGTFGIDFQQYTGTFQIANAGYPGLYDTQPSWDRGTISGSSVDNVYFNQGDLDVNPGNSGGPVYYTNDQGPYAIAIVSTRGYFTSLAGHEFWLRDALTDNDGPPNRAPTGIGWSSGNDIAENAGAGTVVGTLVAEDPDSGDTHRFTLLGDAGGRFTLNGGSVVYDGAPGLDFETARTHPIRVQATDQDGASVTRTLQIDVTDIRETPGGGVSGAVADIFDAVGVVRSAATSLPQGGVLVGPNDVLTGASRLLDTNGRLQDGITFTIGGQSYPVVGARYDVPRDVYDDGQIDLPTWGENYAILELGRPVTPALQGEIRTVASATVPADLTLAGFTFLGPAADPGPGQKQLLPDVSPRYETVDSFTLAAPFDADSKGTPLVRDSDGAVVGIIGNGGPGSTFGGPFFTPAAVAEIRGWIAANDGADRAPPAYVQEVALLYNAALDRDGRFDWPGFNYWVDRVEEGTPLQAVARLFLATAEFETSFGEPLNRFQANYLDDAAYIDQLYFNVLDRAPDAGGRAFWVGRLADGAPREGVLVGIATSPENRAGSPEIMDLAEVSPGFWEFG